MLSPQMEWDKHLVSGAYKILRAQVSPSPFWLGKAGKEKGVGIRQRSLAILFYQKLKSEWTTHHRVRYGHSWFPLRDEPGRGTATATSNPGELG